MAEVFISFIHEEQDWASNLQLFIVRALKTKPFMSADATTIFAGEEWMRRIFDELETAKVLVSMLSPQSVGRPWINFEAGAAWMGKTKVIPVYFGGLTIETLPKPYSSLQAVNLQIYDGMYYLVSSIAHYLDLERPEKPIFPPWSPTSALAGIDPEKNKELLAPYETLYAWMRIFKDIEK